MQAINRIRRNSLMAPYNTGHKQDHMFTDTTRYTVKMNVAVETEADIRLLLIYIRGAIGVSQDILHSDIFGYDTGGVFYGIITVTPP